MDFGDVVSAIHAVLELVKRHELSIAVARLEGAREQLRRKMLFGGREEVDQINADLMRLKSDVEEIECLAKEIEASVVSDTAPLLAVVISLKDDIVDMVQEKKRKSRPR
jgi:ribose 1,5-bisphosphokinase PhnN